MASAAILVGGAASRFEGRDKSALVVGGRSILDRQLAEVTRLTDDIMLVGRTSSSIDAAPAHGEGQIRIVPDRIPGRGPLSGLDAALASSRDDVVILLACDMPFVTSALLAHLAMLAADADAVVPHTARGDHPLCAAYSRACRDAVARRLSSGQLAIRGLLEDIHVRRVTEEELAVFGDPERLLANINRPDDYRLVAG